MRAVTSGCDGDVTRPTHNRCVSVLIRNACARRLRWVSDVGKPQLIVYAAAVLAVALIGARYLQSVSAEATSSGVADRGSAASPVPSSATGASFGGGALTRSQSVVVHVAGAVRRPGVVRLRDGERVADAIRAAGGWRVGADRGGVNLAARVADGQQIVVPTRSAIIDGASGSTGPISLSSATAEQLDQLDGIGPGLAQKIIDFRTQIGGFRSIDQLGDVPGIGDKRLESLRAQLQP